MVCFALFFFFLGLELAGLAPVRPESVCFGSFARVSANRCESGNEKKKTGQGTDARAAVLLARCRVRRRCGAHFATFVHPRAQLVDTSERCQSI